jgi:hypothetical protein
MGQSAIKNGLLLRCEHHVYYSTLVLVAILFCQDNQRLSRCADYQTSSIRVISDLENVRSKVHRPEEKQNRNTLTLYVSLLTGPRRSLTLPAKRVPMDRSRAFAHTVNLHEEYMYAIESSILHIPSHFVVRPRALHDWLEMAIRYPHGVSSANDT